ncbi:hypothetical protein [Nonomuraea pusilla]|uniref:Homeodomain-like domain-containing protein n=1 Tax=Nonomuraea pusilla TaxID=46177 RepID=A0A1H8F554_9ACTN|nr:hypothetical protein [Nonomuraea pusilla]SEN27031.1 hypothetical protein SAMN05660976_07168 [Nonomuraea pusilla]
MPSKEQVLRLLSQGHDYGDIAERLGIPAGRAYLIATGVPADGSDSVARGKPGREGLLTSRSQHLVNPREVNPVTRRDVHAWIRRRAWMDRPMREAARG